MFFRVFPPLFDQSFIGAVLQNEFWRPSYKRTLPGLNHETFHTLAKERIVRADSIGVHRLQKLRDMIVGDIQVRSLYFSHFLIFRPFGMALQ